MNEEDKRKEMEGGANGRDARRKKTNLKRKYWKEKERREKRVEPVEVTQKKGR